MEMQQTIEWEVAKRAIADDATGKTIKGYQYLTRVDPGVAPDQGKVFHVSTDGYNPPSIAEFQDNYEKLAEITGFEKQGFQEWGGGSRIFGYLKNTKEKFDIDGHQIEDYLIMGVGFGGQTSFFVGSVNHLLRCMNEFGNISRNWKIRNTKGRQVKTDELFESFDDHMKQRDLMFETFRRFKDVKIDHNLIIACKRAILDMKDQEKTADLGKIKKAQYSDLTAAIIGETQDLGQNLWGLFNGVTKHTTHGLQKKDTSKNIFGNVAGESRHGKNKIAFEMCKDYMENEAGILLPTN